ncbi:MAG TPA: AAA family ATPase [Planctomycetota bacterium]|nr:AAA family ATPase [Planctomycetota bacterium]
MTSKVTRTPARIDDQAKQLRALAGTADAPALPAIAITGGKGGVGKTCVAVNLTLALAAVGIKPLLVDCDLGLANADVMLGLDPRATLYDVMCENRPIDEAIVADARGFGFVPAASGREELTQLPARSLNRLVREIGRAGADHDVILMDTAAGIGREVSTLVLASRLVLVVLTPDPTSLADAYALVKLVEGKQPGKDIRVLVNLAANQDEATEAFSRLRKVSSTYLRRDLAYAGYLPRDRHVAEAVRKRRPFADGDGPAANALRALALKLKSERWR